MFKYLLYVFKHDSIGKQSPTLSASLLLMLEFDSRLSFYTVELRLVNVHILNEILFSRKCLLEFKLPFPFLSLTISFFRSLPIDSSHDGLLTDTLKT